MTDAAPDPLPHLPRDRAAADAWLEQLDAARDLLRTDAYRGRLTCVLGVAKSASRRLTAMLAELHENAERRRAVFAPSYSPTFRAFELRPETAAEFPHGGVLHCQGPMTPPTITALRTLRANYVVLLRHPADQVCAYTCFTRYLHYRQTCQELGLDPNAGHDPPQWQQRRSELTVSHFVQRSMHRALSFMADWLDWHERDDHPRHPRGVVLRYEDFVADPRRELIRVHQALQDEAPADDRLDTALQQLSEPDAARQRRYDLPGVYPHGDTGRVGLWRDFFNDETRAAYQAVAEAFCTLHPGANLLTARYHGWCNPS